MKCHRQVEFSRGTMLIAYDLAVLLVQQFFSIQVPIVLSIIDYQALNCVQYDSSFFFLLIANYLL